MAAAQIGREGFKFSSSSSEGAAVSSASKLFTVEAVEIETLRVISDMVSLNEKHDEQGLKAQKAKLDELISKLNPLDLADLCKNSLNRLEIEVELKKNELQSLTSDGTTLDKKKIEQINRLIELLQKEKFSRLSLEKQLLQKQADDVIKILNENVEKIRAFCQKIVEIGEEIATINKRIKLLNGNRQYETLWLREVFFNDSKIKALDEEILLANDTIVVLNKANVIKQKQLNECSLENRKLQTTWVNLCSEIKRLSCELDGKVVGPETKEGKSSQDELKKMFSENENWIKEQKEIIKQKSAALLKMKNDMRLLMDEREQIKKSLHSSDSKVIEPKRLEDEIESLEQMEFKLRSEISLNRAMLERLKAKNSEIKAQIKGLDHKVHFQIDERTTFKFDDEGSLKLLLKLLQKEVFDEPIQTQNEDLEDAILQVFKTSFSENESKEEQELDVVKKKLESLINTLPVTELFNKHSLKRITIGILLLKYELDESLFFARPALGFLKKKMADLLEIRNQLIDQKKKQIKALEEKLVVNFEESLCLQKNIEKAVRERNNIEDILKPLFDQKSSLDSFFRSISGADLDVEMQKKREGIQSQISKLQDEIKQLNDQNCINKQRIDVLTNSSNDLSDKITLIHEQLDLVDFEEINQIGIEDKVVESCISDQLDSVSLTVDIDLTMPLKYPENAILKYYQDIRLNKEDGSEELRFKQVKLKLLLDQIPSIKAHLNKYSLIRITIAILMMKKIFDEEDVVDLRTKLSNRIIRLQKIKRSRIVNEGENVKALGIKIAKNLDEVSNEQAKIGLAKKSIREVNDVLVPLKDKLERQAGSDLAMDIDKINETKRLQQLIDVNQKEIQKLEKEIEISKQKIEALSNQNIDFNNLKQTIEENLKLLDFEDFSFDFERKSQKVEEEDENISQRRASMEFFEELYL